MRKTPGRPTIYSLADELGVHPATVSRALNRPHLVRESLRERVLELAHKRGFRPNTAAQALVTGRSGLLGLLVPDVENVYYASVYHVLSSVGAQRGLSVILTDWRFVEDDQAALFERVLGVVDALVVAAPRDDVMKYVEDRDIPLVFVNRLLPDAPSVIVNNRDALWELGDRMLDLGHRRIAIVGGPDDSWAAGQRLADVGEWAAEREVPLEVIGRAEPSVSGGHVMARAVADSGCTAVFCFDDLMAAGLMKGLAEEGLVVPDDVSVVGCDDAMVADITTPALTTIRAPYEELALEVMAIVDRLQEDPQQDLCVEIKGQAVFRQSLAAPASTFKEVE